MDKELHNQINIINETMTSFENIINAIKNIIPKVQTINSSAIQVDKENGNILNKIESISSIAEEISASS